jgi:filamentous hemagglutinin family protein
MGAFADGSILGLPRRASLLAGTGLVSLFAAGLTIGPRPARAQLPTGGQVTAGQATITQTAANRLDINQTSGRAAIDWRGFSIGAGNVVHFQQPGSSAIALNRVTGADPSVIAGQLSATGRVVLINPNGIAFTQGANVDTAGLVASTLNISNGDFMAGRMTFSAPAGQAGSVTNEGTITVRDGGLAALVAPEVRNSGVIRARMGRVVLAGAESVTLDPRGDGLISFEVARSGPPRETRASNTGRIEADGGSVTIAAASARGIVAGVVNVDGVVVANSVGQANGVVTFGSGEAGTTTVSGTVEARGNNAGERGGRIAITGEQVRLTGTARADASGRAGGGDIRAGGGVQGRGAEQNARRTTVERGAVLAANAIDAGRGGSVVVWSDEYTRFMGSISARGGAAGGDGGFAEVSGRIMLEFDGAADLRAPLGGLGTLLLDPTNIAIVAAPGTTTGLDGVPGSGADRAITPTTAAETATLLNTQLATMLNAANVTLTTTSTGAGSGTITVSAPVTWTSGSTLTMTADSSIAVNAAITASAGNGSLTLNAQSGIALGAPVNLGTGTLAMSSTGGAISQNGAGAITAGAVSATLAPGAAAEKFVILNTATNAFGAISGAAVGNSFQAFSSTGFQVRGISASGITLTAGTGSITQAAGAPAALIAGERIVVTANAGSVTLDNPANAVPNVNIAALGAGNAVSYRSGAAFAVGGNGGISAPGLVSLTADTGNITQAGAVSAASLVATATAGNVDLSPVANPVGAIAATAGPAGTVALQTSGALVVNGITAPGGVTLTANAGDITQGAGAANRIVTGGLAATAVAGSVLLGNTTNEVAAVGGSAQGATPTFRLFNATDLDLGTVLVGNAGTLDVQLAGGRTLSVSGAPEIDGGRAILVADSIALAGGSFGGARPATVELRPATAATNIEAGTGAAEAGALLLPTATLDALRPAGGGTFRLGSTGVPVGETATGRITITGYDAADRTLRLESGTADGIRQTAAITAARLQAIAPLGAVALGTSSNAVAQVAGQSLLGFTVRTTGGFQVDGIAAAAQTVTLTADAGSITQAATGGGIVAQTVAANATAGSVTLDGAGNDAQVVQGVTGAGQTFAFTDANAILNGTITTAGGTVRLASSDGTVTVATGINASLLRLDGETGIAQTGAILVGSVVARSENGAVLLDNAANTILRIEGGTGTGGGAFTVNALGALTVGNAAGDVAGISGGGNVTLTAGGNITVAEALRAGAGDALFVQTAAGGTLAVNAGLAAPGGTATLVADTITGTGGFADADRPLATVIRPRSAGTSMGVGTGAAGALALTDAQVLALAPTDTALSTYRFGSVARGGEAAAGQIRIGGTEFGNREVTLESGAVGVAISDVGAFNAGGIIARAPLGSVDLSGFAHQVEAVGVTTLGGFTFASPSGFEVRGIIATGNVTLSATTGDITQAAGAANRIVANALDATASAGSVILDNGANAVTNVTGEALGAGATFGFTDGNSLNVGAISVGANGRIDLRAGPGGTLAITNALAANGGTAQFVADTLTTPGFAGFVGARPTEVVFRTASAGREITAGNAVGGGLELPTFNTLLLLRPVDGGTLRIGSDGAGGAEAASGNITIGGLSFLTLGRLSLRTAAGTISQSGSILGTTTLDARAATGGVDLGSTGNGFAFVTGSAGAGGFSVGAANGLVVQGIDASTGAVTLATNAGSIVQESGTGITAASLVASAGGAGAGVTLDSLLNVVPVVGGSGSTFVFRTLGDLTVSGLAIGNSAQLTAGGTLGQSGVINAGTLVTSSVGTTSLDGFSNNVAALAGTVTGVGGNYRFRDANGFTVAGITAPGEVNLVAVTGGIGQSGAIAANSLLAQALAGDVVLLDGANSVARVGGGAAGGFSFANAGALEVGGLTAGAANLQALAGDLTQSGAISTGALLASAAGAVVLTRADNVAASIGGSAGTSFAFTDANGFTVTALSAGGSATLTALGGDIVQSAAITTPTLTVSAAGGQVALDNAGNQVGTLDGTALGTFTFRDADAIDLAGLSASQTFVTAGGDVTQSGAVTLAGLLSVTSGGAVTLQDAGNLVGSIGGSSALGFAFRDANGFAVAGLSAPGQAVSLTATTGSITQTGAINAALVTATATGGDVTLGSAANTVAAIAGQAGGTFTFRNAGNIDGAGITATALVLDAVGGSITQSGALVVPTITATATGDVLLQNPGNEATTISGSAGGSFAFTDATGFVAGGISAGSVTLQALGGNITQTAPITTGALSATASGAVLLNDATNDATTVAGGGGAFTFRDANGFDVAGIAATGAVALTADAGSITQSASITGSTLDVNAPGGSVLLANPGNDVGTLSGSAGGSFAYRDATSLAVASLNNPGGDVSLRAGGTLSLTGSLAAPGFVVRLQAGGDVAQAAGGGITAAALLAIAGGEVDLAGSNRVGLFAGSGAEVNLRNARTLIIGSIAGDATVHTGLTQAGITATGTGLPNSAIVRVILADPAAPGTPLNLSVNEVISAQRIHLALATGAGTLRANPNLLRGPGGGDPALVLLDVTGIAGPDIATLPTFSGLAGTPPNVPIPITVGTNTNAAIELTSQIMPGTSLYIVINGGLASSDPATINVRGLAVYTGTLGTTRLRLFGFVNGQSGSNAATQSRLSVDASDRFTLNNCPIGTISCVVLPSGVPNVPRFPDELVAGVLPPRIDESTLVFVNVGAEDTDERDEERRVAVGRPAPVPAARQE